MNEILNFLQHSAPVRKEAVWGSATGTIGVISDYLFGVWNDAIEALVILMIADYISGLLAAYINPKLKLDSRIGFRGICKKIMILLLVCVAHFIDRATGQNVVCIAVVWFFIGNEGLSVLENAAKAGLPVPAHLRETLAQLAHEKKERKEKK